MGLSYKHVKKGKKGKKESIRKNLLLKHADLIVLAIIVAYSIFYSVRFLGGPSFYGDDTAYLGEAYFVNQGIFHESPYIFSVRILQFYPIAFFYWLFGVNLITDSLWDIIAFVGSIIIAFYIGKLLLDSKAGILAALSLAFLPNVAMLAPTVSDDVTSMFFVGIVLLAYLYGSKNKSKRAYFIAGAFFVWGILVTPEALLMDLAIVLLVFIDITSKRTKLDKNFLFIVYGIIFAGALLMLFNYLNCGDPLITLKVNGGFYSKVGGTHNIPSTNIDPRFYLNTMFPYNFFSNMMNGHLPTNYVMNSFSGFFFYVLFTLLFLLPIFKIRKVWLKLVYVALIILVSFCYLKYLVPIQNSAPCTSYTISPDCPLKIFYLTLIPFSILLVELILLRKEYPLFAPFVVFLAGLLLLNYGPMSISLHPFQYLIVYRLQRFIAVLGIPIAVLLGVAFAEIISYFKKRKVLLALTLLVVAVVMTFLIYTSLRILIFDYNILAYQRYDQLAIANYLMQYPSYTKIYFASSFSNVPIYMKFENMSRFLAYDNIQNCREIPNGSFVIIPKFNQQFDLNYTPHPRKYCPYWKLVLYPQYPYYYNESTFGLNVFGAKLYVVGNVSLINSTPVNVVTTSTTIPTTTTISFSNFNYFNLTGVGYLNPETHQLENFTTVNKVDAVFISLNRSSAAPGEYVSLNVIFVGEFKWYANPATSYYLNQTIHEPLINFHYYGVELANQSHMLLVQNNGPWYNYITQIGEPHQLLYKNASHYLLVHWVITPNQSMVGKSLKFCGGYYATYNNTKLMGGFGNLYNYLAYNRTYVVNASVINIPSQNCSILNVT
ncbi:MAG: ArnT family glycosyltransferase [Candidatus Micrarchaeia archaeon]